MRPPSDRALFLVLTDVIDPNATKQHIRSTIEGWLEDDDCRWALRTLLSFYDEPDGETEGT